MGVFMKNKIINQLMLRRFLCLMLSTTLLGSSLYGCGNTQSDTAASVQTEASQDNNSSEIQSEALSELTTESNTASATNTTTDTDTSDWLSANAKYPLPTSAEDASIYIEPIPEITDDFIRGMDVSSILAQENSGVIYYNASGEEQDVFTTFAESGVNYARIRVWNDPYDENGNGYGGGNCDLETAIELGKRATENGMKVCIDFHYSDFWADPKKQQAPKAWEGMNLEEKSNVLYEYTKESLTALLDAGVDVGMVQVGNETNNGMCGETIIPNIAQLMSSGSRAIREVSDSYDKNIQVALHYTDVTDFDKIDSIMYKLSSFQVDYDIFAVSYYPFWHGTLDNLTKVLNNIQEKYNKETLIAETSYAFTLEDTDGTGNSVGAEDLIPEYAATVQSQATALRDVCATAYAAGGLGVFYWEGAWISVNDSAADNSPIWEKYGSGWASSYAASYDPNDAGKYYGGSSWDNQALFDSKGMPLESINTYKWLKYGTNAPLAVDFVPVTNVASNVDSEITLPDTLDVIYNDRKQNSSAAVTWNADEVSAIDTSVDGDYVINGTLEDGTAVTCNLSVSLLNLVQNPSFEDSDTSMWEVSYEGDKNPTDFQEKAADAHTDNYSFHFWSESDMEFTIVQNFTDLEPGTYSLKAFFQGGDINSDATMELFATTSDEASKQSAPFSAQGYAVWQEPTIDEIEVTDGTLTIGVAIKCNAKGWGTIDDFTLNKIK